MENAGIYPATLGVVALSAIATHDAWRRGWCKAVLSALALILIVAGLCWYRAETTRGDKFSGFIEALTALALVFGPAAGIVLGIVTANWKWIGLTLAGLYGLGLAALFVWMAS